MDTKKSQTLVFLIASVVFLVVMVIGLMIADPMWRNILDLNCGTFSSNMSLSAMDAWLDCSDEMQPKYLPWLFGVPFALAGLLAYIAGLYAKANLSNSAPISTGGASSNRIEAEIQKLDDMKRRGVIDDAEYKRLRDNLINRS